MIDEVRITNIGAWDPHRVADLRDELAYALPQSVDVALARVGTPQVRVEISLPDEWPHLRRENVHQTTQQRLAALEYNHGLEATVQRIEETGKDDRDAAFDPESEG